MSNFVITLSKYHVTLIVLASDYPDAKAKALTAIRQKFSHDVNAGDLEANRFEHFQVLILDETEIHAEIV
jgi:predicted dinucleotide-binding enzyme